MTHRPYRAVLHCSAKQTNKLINLGNKVVAGLTANAAIYPAPNPTVAVLSAEMTKLVSMQAGAKNGGKEATAKRDAEALKIFGMLSTELLYVNMIAQGDRDKILLSGFEINEQPSPNDVPDKISIKSIEVGPVDHSVKITLGTLSNPLQISKQRLHFIVEMSTEPSFENWVDVLHSGNSRKLIITNLVRKTEYHFRISAENAKGKGPASDPVSFVAQ